MFENVFKKVYEEHEKETFADEFKDYGSTAVP